MPQTVVVDVTQDHRSLSPSRLRFARICETTSYVKRDNLLSVREICHKVFDCTWERTIGSRGGVDAELSNCTSLRHQS